MGRPERALRFFLLALLWLAWLSLRALWLLVEWLVSREGRGRLGRWCAALLLAAGIALLPKAGGLVWGWLLLKDAVEIAAMQSDGRDLREIEVSLRRRAFALGFTDIVFQEEAVRVERQAGPEGVTCAIDLDFHHRVDLYGWAAPRFRIHLAVEKPVLPKPPESSLEDLFS